MRGSLIGRAAAVSIAVHLALLLGSDALDRARTTAIVEGEPAPEPLAVTIVEIEEVGDEPADPIRTNTPEGLPAGSDRVASIDTSRPDRTGASGESLPTGEPPRAVGEQKERPTGSLTMRDRRKSNRSGLRDSLYPVAPTAGPPEGTSPLKEVTAPRRTESELRRRSDGDYETDGGTFVARTHSDGTVKIKDRRNFNIRFNLPSKKVVGALLKSWQADPYKHARGESDVELPSDAVVAGGFDVTDAFMRSIGDDPYITKKLDLLERTRDERAGIAMKNKSENLADSARSSRKILAAVHARSDLAADEKRLIYFELWDECAEVGSPEVLDAARTVRATITGFIATKLPKGSADSYSDAELAKLNSKRVSKARFSPYPKTR